MTAVSSREKHVTPSIKPTTAALPDEELAPEVVLTDESDPESPVGWRIDALCLQFDPEVFFPEKGGGVHAAKKICGQCNVADDCLREALDRQEPFGIWGGKSERQRHRMLVRSGKAKPRYDDDLAVAG